MRALAFVLVVAAGACSAVDDFSRFKFDGGDPAAGGGGTAGGGGVAAGGGGGTAGGGGATGGADLAVAHDAGPDLAVMLPGYGAPCSGDCAPPYSCFHLGNKDITGICSRTCSTSGSSACAGVDATCVTVEGQTLCMPNCNALGKTCRSDLTCCANGKPTTLTPGQCAPASTDFCGKG